MGILPAGWGAHLRVAANIAELSWDAAEAGWEGDCFTRWKEGSQGCACWTCFLYWLRGSAEPAEESASAHCEGCCSSLLWGIAKGCLGSGCLGKICCLPEKASRVHVLFAGATRVGVSVLVLEAVLT